MNRTWRHGGCITRLACSSVGDGPRRISSLQRGQRSQQQGGEVTILRNLVEGLGSVSCLVLVMATPSVVGFMVSSLR